MIASTTYGIINIHIYLYKFSFLLFPFSSKEWRHLGEPHSYNVSKHWTAAYMVVRHAHHMRAPGGARRETHTPHKGEAWGAQCMRLAPIILFPSPLPPLCYAVTMCCSRHHPSVPSPPFCWFTAVVSIRLCPSAGVCYCRPRRLLLSSLSIVAADCCRHPPFQPICELASSQLHFPLLIRIQFVHKIHLHFSLFRSLICYLRQWG